MVLSGLDLRILDGIKIYFNDIKFYSSAKKQYLQERKQELLAEQSLFACKIWIDFVKAGDAQGALEAERAVYYSIKCEWTESAEAFFNYEKKSIVLKDDVLGLEITFGGKDD